MKNDFQPLDIDDEESKNLYRCWLKNTFVSQNPDKYYCVFSATHYGRLSPLYQTQEEANSNRRSMGGAVVPNWELLADLGIAPKAAAIANKLKDEVQP